MPNSSGETVTQGVGALLPEPIVELSVAELAWDESADACIAIGGQQPGIIPFLMNGKVILESQLAGL
jgi:hypothetical protein